MDIHRQLFNGDTIRQELLKQYSTCDLVFFHYVFDFLFHFMLIFFRRLHFSHIAYQYILPDFFFVLKKTLFHHHYINTEKNRLISITGNKFSNKMTFELFA